MSGAWWNTWCVVLAGGEGSRLAPLTQALYGRPVPKQFAELAGKGSMLQNTVERMRAAIPAERIVVVVSEEHAALARAQLEPYPGTTIVPQPRNLGTALGILLGLAHVRRMAPRGRVVITPADHHIPRPKPLLRQLARALSHDPTAITLAAVTADSPETEYGWIIPGAGVLDDLHEVKTFVEKPSAQRATELLSAGGLWNTFVFATSVERLWKLFEDTLPDQTRTLWNAAGDPERLRAAYATLQTVNFSHDVLERCSGLRVITVRDSGWTDFGTPGRVLGSAAVRRDVVLAGASLAGTSARTATAGENRVAAA